LEEYFDYVVKLPMVYLEEANGDLRVAGETLEAYLLNGASADQFDQLYRAHETTYWPVARLRWWAEGRCSIEVRMACAQAPGERMTVPALVLGLIENLAEAERLSNSLTFAQWKQVRQLAVHYGLQFTMPSGACSTIEAARRLVNIAKHGLLSRGLGEEVWLAPIERRLADEKPYSPADEAISDFREGGIEQLVKERVYRAC